MKNFVIACFALMVFTTAFGQNRSPYMVKDIYPGGLDVVSEALKPTSTFASLNGTTFFFQGTGLPNTNAELWSSDGTDVGTAIFLDINPSGASSPANFTTVGNNIFFTANDGVHGAELWKTDGTVAGTTQVKDIISGPASSSPKDFMIVGSTLYFLASDPTGYALWKSDGTAAGTLKISDGFGWDPVYSKTIYGVMNSILFFVAYDTANLYGNELWRTDGTAAGTYIVKDINPGNSSSNIKKIAVFGSAIYFGAGNGTNDGHELWKSDGTAAGTFMLKDINTSLSFDSYITEFATLGADLYFLAYDEHDKNLWKTDGTTQGTIRVKDFNPDGSGGNVGSYDPSGLVTVGVTLYFAKLTLTAGRELWKSDGTGAGTVMIGDFCPGPANLIDNYAFDGFKVVGSNLYFVGYDGTHGLELWKTNGTASGTYMVKDIKSGINGGLSVFRAFESSCVIGSTFYFVADDDINGRELWKTDGNTFGTVMVKNIIAVGASGNNGMTRLSEFIANDYLGTDAYGKINNTIFFIANDGLHGNELWKSDGTDAGTVLVKDITPGAIGTVLTKFCNAGPYLFFYTGTDLWRTDGTDAGTIFLKMIVMQQMERMATMGSSVYFGGNGDANGYELWKSDGTVAGTVMVKDILPGSDWSMGYGNDMKVMGNSLYFAARNTAASNQSVLFKTDGTAAGTVMVRDIYNPRNFTTTGNLMYFNDENGNKLYKSDGTWAGTTLVTTFNTNNDRPSPMQSLGNTVFFVNKDSAHGSELWKSDGTAAGTTFVKDINPGSNDSVDRTFGFSLPVFNSYLYFTAKDGLHGNAYQLWKSDGTEAGTTMVTDLTMYPSNYRFGVVSGSELFFNAIVSQTGSYQLFATDGTQTNTFPVANIPAFDLKDINGKLYFVNDTPGYGRELWALGNCGRVNPIVTVVGPNTRVGAQRQALSATETCYCNFNNDLIATVDAIGSNPLSGEIAVETKIENFQPSDRVKRYTSILPYNNFNITTATGRVTLYFTQQEFNDFNAVNPTALLAIDANDNQGKSNARIYKATLGASEVIDPNDTDVIWNASLNRWEITFDTTGFGYFFLVTNATALGQNEFDAGRLSYYPNPTNGMFYIEAKQPIDLVALYDIIGHKLYEQTIHQNQAALDLERFDRGIYMLEVRSENKTQIIKVVKK